ncbi:MAG: hypothetical protein J6328_02470, partial [Bacilli bacterium]|nr:hypothetical protein [Bacilli bacterium]
MSQRLKEEFLPYGITIDIKKASVLGLAIERDSKVSPAKLPYDFAIYLDKDPYISVLLEQTGLPIFNSAAA